MDLNIEHDEKYQQFSVSLGDDDAELAYAKPTEDVMDFTHTYVPDKERGKGIANELIKHGLHYADTKGYQVIATCPAVKSFIARYPEYERLLKE